MELGDWEGLTATADYDGFGLASAADNYRLHVDNFTGGSAGEMRSLCLYGKSLRLSFDSRHYIILICFGTSFCQLCYLGKSRNSFLVES